MPVHRFVVNDSATTVDAEADTPLLWVLRDSLGLLGVKFGCGAGLCGACTVHVDGEAVRACVTTLDAVAGRQITTIEGLSSDGSHPLQQAWIAEQVSQCGYCQAGFIMAAAALLARKHTPSDADVDGALGGNLCRCGTYLRIRRAVRRAAEAAQGRRR